MSKNIRLSPEHGLNPTMGICMWCGEPTNEIALLGKLPKDAEAPRYSVVSYEPCDKCKETWNKGIALIECSEARPDNRPPFTKNVYGNEVYPTGRFIVLSVEGVKHFFDRDMEVGKILAIDEQVYSKLAEIMHNSSDSEDNKE